MLIAVARSESRSVATPGNVPEPAAKMSGQRGAATTKTDLGTAAAFGSCMHRAPEIVCSEYFCEIGVALARARANRACSTKGIQPVSKSTDAPSSTSKSQAFVQVEELLSGARALENSDRIRAAELARQAAELALDRKREDLHARALIVQGAIAIADAAFERAEEFYAAAREISARRRDVRGQADALGGLGVAHFMQGRYREAFQCSRRSLAACEEADDVAGQARECSRLGGLFQHFGDMQAALDHQLKALGLLRPLRQTRDLAACLNNLALVYKDLGQYDTALSYYRECLELCDAIGSRDGKALVLVNIGTIHNLRGEKREALEYFEQAVDLARTIRDRRKETIALTSVAGILLDLGEADKACDTYLAANTIARDIKLGRSVAITLIGLGRSRGSQGLFDEAAACLAEAAEYTEQSDILHLKSDLYDALTKLCEQRGDYRTALEHSRRRREVDYQMINQRTDERLNNLRILHETEQARNQAEIRRLENVELAAANERLEELIRNKNEFLGVAAHDLRNPLSNIQGLARLITTQADRLSPEETRELADDIRTSSQRMLTLVADLLDINRIDQGRLHIKPMQFDLAHTAKRYLSVYSSPAQAKNIQLQYQGPDDDVLAWADRDVIVQVLDNLVSNAVKFSPAETCVTVATSTNLSVFPARARLEVRDQGPGLTNDDMAQLFGKFARLSAQPTGGEPSTGLGLSIVKQLVEAMHGAVWCESTHGRGATFIVELPVRPVGDSGSAD